MQKCFIKKLNSTKLKWNTWVELVLIRGCLSWVLSPGVFLRDIHLRMATQEQRDQSFLQVKIASSVAIGHMGSVLIN